MLMLILRKRSPTHPTTPVAPDTLGGKMRALRVDHHLTLAQMAIAINARTRHHTNAGALSLYELNKRMPSVDMLVVYETLFHAPGQLTSLRAQSKPSRRREATRIREESLSRVLPDTQESPQTRHFHTQVLRLFQDVVTRLRITRPDLSAVLSELCQRPILTRHILLWEQNPSHLPTDVRKAFRLLQEHCRQASH